MIEHFKFKECWLMNWTNTKEKEIVMWKRIFERFKSYIWIKKKKEMKEEWRTKK